MNMEKDDNQYYDDCPICRLMRACEKEGRQPTEEELKKAFSEAQEQGGAVGGEWFK